jgi:hypothetical protein
LCRRREDDRGNDIVERLRAREPNAADMQEAAAEIERLRAALRWQDTHPIIEETWNDALEEAAQVAERYAEDEPMIHSLPSRLHHAKAIAGAIRALKGGEK